MNNGLRLVPVSALPSNPEPNTLYQVGTTVTLCDANGALVTIGLNPVVGQVALVAGTKAVAIPGLLTTSIVFIQLVTPANAANTVERQAVATANTLTITALLAAHSINVADTSTVNYIAFI